MQKLPIWLSEYIGIPWVKHGRTGTGVDCWGLLWLIYSKHFRIDINGLLSAYDDTGIGAREVSGVIDGEKSNWRCVEQENVRLGDVVVFNLASIPSHVGMLLDSDNFIHVLEGTHSVIDKWKGLNWASRIEGVYRCPAL